MMMGLYRYLRLTHLFTKKAVKGMMTYRWSFLINCISQALDYSVTFLLMWIMISAFEDMNGWNAYEMMLLYAFSLFAYGIAGTFFFNIMNLLPGQILKGAFDDVLIKPVKVLPYLISSSFICNYIAHMMLSAIVMAVCFKALHIQVTVRLLWRAAGILVVRQPDLRRIISDCKRLGVSCGKDRFSVSDYVFFQGSILLSDFYFSENYSGDCYYACALRVCQLLPAQRTSGEGRRHRIPAGSGIEPARCSAFFAVSCLLFHQSSKCYKSSGS